VQRDMAMQNALTQQELESRLWAAANSLRGPVDPADFKAYIFPLLFFRRVSDTWDDEHDRALADYNGQLTPEIEADYHRFQMPDGCHWRDLRRLTENVGVGLQNILDRIQQANPDTLAGIFGDVGWGNKEKLPEHALLNLIEAFNTLDLRPSRVGHDVLGNAYEYLLRQFADESGKKAASSSHRARSCASSRASSTLSPPTRSTTLRSARAACSLRLPTKSSRPAARSARCGSPVRRSTSRRRPSPA